jgi:hypothetical protein
MVNLPLSVFPVTITLIIVFSYAFTVSWTDLEHRAYNTLEIIKQS